MKFSGIKKADFSDGSEIITVNQIVPSSSYSEKAVAEKDFDGKTLPKYIEKNLKIASYDFSVFERLANWMYGGTQVASVVLEGVGGESFTWAHPTYLLVRKVFSGKRIAFEIRMKFKEIL